MASTRDNRIHTFTQYGAALSANTGVFAVGMAIGWTSPVENRLMHGEYGFSINYKQFSWISSLLALGAACMCIPTGFLINKLGRKFTLLLLVLPFTLGWCLLIWAQNVIWIYSGRFIMGLSGGAYCVAIPVYTSEIAHKEIRGILGSLCQLLITIGIFFTYAIGGCLKVFSLNVVCGVTPFLFGIIFSFMPESPTYLISKGKDEIAIKNLKWLHGKNYDYMSEIDELKKTDEESKNNATSTRKAFLKRAALKALFINFGLMLFQQLCGINAVIFYSMCIMHDAKTGVNEYISTLIIAALLVLGSLVSVFLMDKIGRRFLLLLSAFVMATSTLSLGFYFYMKDNDVGSVKTLYWLPVTSLCLFITSFSLGFGPVPWLMVAELFASNIRSVASSLVITLNWVLAFVVAKTFVDFKETIGDGPTFWIFSSITFLGVVFVFLCVPETKGKSFNEIQQILEGHESSKKNSTMQPNNTFK